MTHYDDGKRFIVRADEKLTAFVDLESAIRKFFPNFTPQFSEKKLRDGPTIQTKFLRGPYVTYE